MLRSVKILAQRLPTCSNALRQPFFIRKYLTSAFGCEAAWNKRLESPYIKKIKISDMFYELENQFLHFGKANGIDIDLFANAITDDSHLDEVEDVIHKLRLSPEATNLLPSTQHAFVRTMLSYGDVDELLRILDDRLNYGIFMDDYCCILLLNKFLKVENYKNAARVAAIHMLQEDFSHPIIKYMSLFACHKYVLNPVSWVPEQPQSEENNEDDDEEIRLRVRYIRNPFFDDHFDLRNPSHLVGKTLWMIGNEIPDILGRSYTLLGYTLHEKWDKLQEYISTLLDLKEKPVVFKESVTIVQKLIEETALKENESNSIKNKEEIVSLLSKLANSGVLSEENFLKTTEDKMKQCVSEHEKKTIEQQLEVYDQWEKQRAALINEHIEKLKREKTLKEIEETKQKLKEKEDELFFFENEDKLDMIIENKRVRYPKKWLGKKKQKRAVDAEYVPPEIEKRREN